MCEKYFFIKKIRFLLFIIWNFPIKENSHFHNKIRQRKKFENASISSSQIFPTLILYVFKLYRNISSQKNSGISDLIFKKHFGSFLGYFCHLWCDLGEINSIMYCSNDLGEVNTYLQICLIKPLLTKLKVALHCPFNSKPLVVRHN